MKGLVALVVLALPLPAAATRYALIVGNNMGRSSSVVLEPLQHAEREAGLLRQQLVRYGNFDPERAVLVTGGGRAAILDAARRLAELHARDAQSLGRLPTLFTFAFTGHGLAGQLLTADEPLSGGDLAGIFKDMGASLTIGFFDACYSGGIDFEALRAKGAVPTPGFNPVAELPGELLSSEGTLWFVSSRPDELSYEDRELGGLFTHFLSEAFTGAHAEGIGVEVEDMWEYARRRTVAHAQRHGRHQTPQRMVRKLRARGPIYLSFPVERTAVVEIDRAVAGTFVLQYEHGSYLETVTKSAGQPLLVPVYEGEVVLTRAAGADDRPKTMRLAIRPGDRIRVRPDGTLGGAEPLGYGEAHVRGKGGELPGLSLTTPAPRLTVAAGAGAVGRLLARGVLAPPWKVAATAWLGRGALSASLRAAWGPLGRRYQAWSYDGQALHASVGLGGGLSFGALRLDAELSGGPIWQSVRYSGGGEKRTVGLDSEIAARLSVPLAEHLVLQAQLGAAVLYGESERLRLRSHEWSVAPQLGLGVLVRVP